MGDFVDKIQNTQRSKVREKQKTWRLWKRLSDEPKETVGSRSRFRQANSAEYAKLQQAAERQVMDYFKKGKGKRFGFKAVKHAATSRELLFVNSENELFVACFGEFEFEEIDENITLIRNFGVEFDEDNLKLKRKEHASAMVVDKKSARLKIDVDPSTYYLVRQVDQFGETSTKAYTEAEYIKQHSKNATKLAKKKNRKRVNNSGFD